MSTVGVCVCMCVRARVCVYLHTGTSLAYAGSLARVGTFVNVPATLRSVLLHQLDAVELSAG